MKHIIKKHADKKNSLEEVKVAVLEALKEISLISDSGRLGYVSGIMTSDGPEYTERNIKILEQYTEDLRNTNNFPVFSATDVFDQELFRRIDSHNIPVQEWFDFWREILRNGLITHIFMTPRWEKSKGAIDEYETAKELGLEVIVVE